MLTDSTVIDLIGLIYDAAIDPQQWTLFLEKLAGLLHTGCATFDFFDLRANRGGVALAIGITDDQLRSYTDYYSARNDLYPKIAASGLLVPGAIVENRSVYSDSDFSRTEYCADFLEKQVGVFHAIGSAVLRNEAACSNISILRKRSQPFEDEERKFLGTLMPHLQRSLSIWQRIAAAEMDRALTLGAIDRLPTATIIVDHSGAVTVMNAAAMRILNRRDGLAKDHDRLVADWPSETVQLRDLIDGALGRAEAATAGRGGVISIRRPSGKRPFVLSVAPLPSIVQPMVFQAGPAAVILISDPEQEIEPDYELLRRIHGLTSAESYVAASLLRGSALKDVAAELKISVATARTHLKRIMTKTDTRRQSELLLLLRRTTDVTARRRDLGA